MDKIVEDLLYGKAVRELLDNDNTYRYVPKNDNWLNKLFYKSGPEPKTPERIAYELGAKYYFKMGAQSDKLLPDNIIERNSEFHRRVCTLMNKLGISVYYNLHHYGLNITIDKDKIDELERVLKQEGI